MQKLKIAIFGFAHPHIHQLVQSFNLQSATAEYIGCVDLPPFLDAPLHGRTQRMLGCFPGQTVPPVFTDPQLLMDQKPDLALVCTDNQSHGQLVEQLMQRGIHTVVEKPMAVSLAEGTRMFRAAQASSATLAVNWPVTWQPAYRYAYDLVRQGAIGEPLRFHYRNPDSLGPFSHGKEIPSPTVLAASWWYQQQYGGGALLDYCGYGCLMATWFMGATAAAAFGYRVNQLAPFGGVEDYSTMTLAFPKGVALLEGSWATLSNGGIATGPVIFGTTGTLVTDRYSNAVSIYRKLHGTQPDEVYEAPPIGEDIATVMIDHIRHGAPLHPTLDLELNMQALAALDAGIRACASGRMENIQ